MSDTTTKRGQFNPVHAAHAIEQVMLVLQFDRPLDDVFFQRVRDTAKQFKKKLPAESDIQGVTFVIGPEVREKAATSHGFSLRRMEPDGAVGHELRIERSSLAFITTLYTRWDAVWSQAAEYFDALAPIYVEQVGLAGAGVNYVDKFVWSGELSECRPAILLRENSKYICPYVYSTEDFWHSHTGAFIRVDSNTKRLLNVNIDYLEVQKQDETSRIVVFTTVLTDQLNQLGYESYSVTPESIVEVVNARMKSLHIFSKEIFGSLINDTMSRRIALMG